MKSGPFQMGRGLAVIDGMDEAEFDQLIARASDPNLIPGIYNYCDRRCDRCRFADRCFQNLESKRRRAVDAESEDFADAMRKSLAETMDLLRIVANRQGFSLPSDVELDADEDREGQDRLGRAVGDPAVVLSRQYAMTAWPITRALWPMLMPRGDVEMIEALETIETLCRLVSSKSFRAVHGSLEEDFDATDLQSDANGSAKVARLLVDESRRAWRVLMEAGRAAADGVPAKLVKMLDDLDAALASRFPRAMEFVRPGFDAAPRLSQDGDAEARLAIPQGHA